MYPIAEYGQVDPLLQSSSAVTMGVVYRREEIPQLANLLIFGDNPSGEVFHVSADKLPNGGQDAIRRILFNDKGEAKTLLQLVKDKNVAQGKPASTRADLRFGEGPNGEIFILTKRDGVIRQREITDLAAETQECRRSSVGATSVGRNSVGATSVGRNSVAHWVAPPNQDHHLSDQTL